LLISNKGVEIERIEEYDTIACFLNDMGYTPEQRNARLHEGMGCFNGINNSVTDGNQTSNSIYASAAGN